MRGLLTDKKLPKKLHRCRTPFQNLLLYSPINIGRVPLSYFLLESHIIYATQRKGFGERGLNLSVSGAVAQDVPEMARQLVKMVMMVTMMMTMMMTMTMIITMMIRKSLGLLIHLLRFKFIKWELIKCNQGILLTCWLS